MGPLKGLKVIEMQAIGPVPMCCMLLADLGADVLRIERVGPTKLGIGREPRFDLVLRSREAVALDLKRPEDVAVALDLIAKADVLVEGFRPGVMERLGLGPDKCLGRHPGLVYGRMTGWGQDGEMAQRAGHDINYIALAGALHGIGRAGQPPTPPLNLVGDYGGGALYLALGVMSALFERQASGLGQVVDAAIVDGTASLMTVFAGMARQGLVDDARGTNVVDSGAYFYDVYECADGRWISVGAIEPKFYQELLEGLGLDPASMPRQHDRAEWPHGRAILAERFRARPLYEWVALFEGTDACVAPVLRLQEAAEHPHLQARGTFLELDGIVQPAPAPRFSRSQPQRPTPPRAADPSHHNDLIQRWLA